MFRLSNSKLLFLSSLGLIIVFQILLHPTSFDSSSLISMNIGVGATGGGSIPTPTIGVGSTAPTYTPTPTFTLTPTNTPTETPTPTFTPTPTATNTPTPTPIPYVLIIDNADSGFSRSGIWKTSTEGTGYYGINYLHDNNAQKGKKYALWTFNLPQSGTYNVAIRYVSGLDRATNVPVAVAHQGGTTIVTVNQQINGGQWFSLGNFPFNTQTSYIQIRTLGTKGYVVADAVRIEKLQ